MRTLNYNNEQVSNIINKAISNTMLTTNSEGSLLPPDYGEQFFTELIADDESFLKKCTYTLRKSPKGKITLFNISDRNLRKKDEDSEAADGFKASFKEIPYIVEEVGCRNEFSNKELRDNLEGSNFLNTLKGAIMKKVRKEIVDLAFNGDESIDINNPDYDFLCINDGWIKQIKKQSNLVDGSALNDGSFTDNYFFELRKSVPKKYRTDKYKWICSDTTKLNYMQFLRDRPTNLGDKIMNENGNSIAALGVPFEVLECMPDNIIIYADPKNLMLVSTYDVSMKYTDTGKELTSKDHALIATFLNFDPVIIRPEAIGILINVGDLKQ